jgi:hypothetical protein
MKRLVPSFLRRGSKNNTVQSDEDNTGLTSPYMPGLPLGTQDNYVPSDMPGPQLRRRSKNSNVQSDEDSDSDTYYVMPPYMPGPQLVPQFHFPVMPMPPPQIIPSIPPWEPGVPLMPMNGPWTSNWGDDYEDSHDYYDDLLPRRRRRNTSWSNTSSSRRSSPVPQPPPGHQFTTPPAMSPPVVATPPATFTPPPPVIVPDTAPFQGWPEASFTQWWPEASNKTSPSYSQWGDIPGHPNTWADILGHSNTVPPASQPSPGRRLWLDSLHHGPWLKIHRVSSMLALIQLPLCAPTEFCFVCLAHR